MQISNRVRNLGQSIKQNGRSLVLDVLSELWSREERDV